MLIFLIITYILQLFKRKYLSKNNRYVISVWNKGKISSDGKQRRENSDPWTVYFNDRDITDTVSTIRNAIPEKEDILLGILEL